MLAVFPNIRKISGSVFSQDSSYSVEVAVCKKYIISSLPLSIINFVRFSFSSFKNSGES